MNTERWEHFQHDADIGIRGFGPTREAALEQVALAMTAVITDLALVRPEEAVMIQCDEPDDALLVADWLNALVYEMAWRHMLFGCFQVTLTGSHLEGVAWGEPVEVARHQPVVEIKGATYTELRMERNPEGGWLAQCVVDV
jgi:tRNA nucleotidyltransferase (CCA-adding enzyme)